ncbi:MAG: archease [Euryarchaeota archaeon]|nr:archease [Euryarchaeota archaeon]
MIPISRADQGHPHLTPQLSIVLQYLETSPISRKLSPIPRIRLRSVAYASFGLSVLTIFIASDVSHEEIVFSRFDVRINRRDDRYHIRAHASGESIDMEKHRFDVAVKAVTFHDMKIEQMDGGA